MEETEQVGVPVRGRSEPSEPGSPGALCRAALLQHGGSPGTQYVQESRGVRRPGGTRQELRQSGGLTARPGTGRSPKSLAAGPGACDTNFTLDQTEVREGVCSRCLQEVILRKMLFLRNWAREAGALGLFGLRRRRVTEGHPGAGGGEQRPRSRRPPAVLSPPDLAAISRAACDAPATQCYRFRAEATSGHTCCTANS